MRKRRWRILALAVIVLTVPPANAQLAWAPLNRDPLIGRYESAPFNATGRSCEFWWDEATGSLRCLWMFPTGNGQVVVREGVVTAERRGRSGEILQIRVRVTRAVKSIGSGSVERLSHGSFRFLVIRAHGVVELMPLDDYPPEFGTESPILWRVGYPRLRVDRLPSRAWGTYGVGLGRTPPGMPFRFLEGAKMLGFSEGGSTTGATFESRLDVRALTARADLELRPPEWMRWRHQGQFSGPYDVGYSMPSAGHETEIKIDAGENGYTYVSIAWRTRPIDELRMLLRRLSRAEKM